MKNTVGWGAGKYCIQEAGILYSVVASPVGLGDNLEDVWETVKWLSGRVRV